MKSGLIHVCFVLDESGSMASSTSDVKGGFKTVIDEQKALTQGECMVSLFTFKSRVKQVYLGKNVNDIDPDALDYHPGGTTAMNDGIATAIDSVGKWLSDMDENERPEKNLIVIMTDGYENASKEFTLEQVREKIKHQTEKYNWSFIYMGTDVSDSSYTNQLMGGLSNCTTMYNTRENHLKNYDTVITGVSTWRSMADATYDVKSASFEVTLSSLADAITTDYEKTTGNKVR